MYQSYFCFIFSKFASFNCKVFTYETMVEMAGTAPACKEVLAMILLSVVDSRYDIATRKPTK